MTSSHSPHKELHILGTRGIPASHGGFETFAEKLAIYLRDHGWAVIVYCQDYGNYGLRREAWNGITLIRIALPWHSAWGSILFDLRAACHAVKYSGVMLTLGYNTALFSLLYRLWRKPQVMNMDGLEWQRDKWSRLAKAWLYCNERAGCLLADHLIADHPVIEDHLGTRVRRNKITMIPYGADEPVDVDLSVLDQLEIEPFAYVLIVARPEPENSVLEMVQAFSARRRGLKLVVLGRFDLKASDYHRLVHSSASEEVLFPGAIYDKRKLAALRKNCLLYMHGHRVGGTNPSLVEALAARSPVLAHDNPFNRWVAGDQAAYFRDVEQCSQELESLLCDRKRLASMAAASHSRYAQAFTWPAILADYETLLSRFQ